MKTNLLLPNFIWVLFAVLLNSCLCTKKIDFSSKPDFESTKIKILKSIIVRDYHITHIDSPVNKFLRYADSVGAKIDSCNCKETDGSVLKLVSFNNESIFEEVLTGEPYDNISGSSSGPQGCLLYTSPSPRDA